MDPKHLVDGLLLYLGLLVLLTFHEFGHAWTAHKLGDDTARLQGRVSLNPLVHMDLIGTVLLPLGMLLLTPAGWLIGWARPVPVNPSNLRNSRRDDILVTLAGPGMNLVLAVALAGLARVGMAVGSEAMVELCLRTARLSLLLCFFNLLPVPPLDGSQIVRSAVGMKLETYYAISRYGFLILIVLLQVPGVWRALNRVTTGSLQLICGWFGLVGA